MKTNDNKKQKVLNEIPSVICYILHFNLFDSLGFVRLAHSSHYCMKKSMTKIRRVASK